jgi:hypothetical protein
MNLTLSGVAATCKNPPRAFIVPLFQGGWSRELCD